MILIKVDTNTKDPKIKYYMVTNKNGKCPKQFLVIANKTKENFCKSLMNTIQ